MANRLGTLQEMTRIASMCFLTPGDIEKAEPNHVDPDIRGNHVNHLHIFGAQLQVDTADMLKINMWGV